MAAAPLPQVLVGVTVTFPLVLPKVTEMLVPLPVKVDPVGTVQVYPVAPVTAEIL